MNISTEKKILDLKNRLVGRGRECEGLGAWGKWMQTIAHGMDLH